MEFTKLFQPGVIGGLQIKNRMIMSPMGTHFPEEDGSVGDRLINYYVERAKGGVGAIMVEATMPTFGRPHRLCIAHDRFIPGLARLAEAIRHAGAAATLFLFEPGKPMDA